MPDGVSVVIAKRVLSWKIDAKGPIIEAKARLVSHSFGKRFAVQICEMFVATTLMASTKLIMAVAVQKGWSLYLFDMTQAFVRAEVETGVYMKFPEGCDTPGKAVKREE